MHLREARVKARHTQAQMAGAMHIPESRYLKIERGGQKPTPEIRAALKRFFGDEEIAFGQPPNGIPSKVIKCRPLPSEAVPDAASAGTVSHHDRNGLANKPAVVVAGLSEMRTAIDMIVEALGEQESLNRLLKR